MTFSASLIGPVLAMLDATAGRQHPDRDVRLHDDHAIVALWRSKAESATCCVVVQADRVSATAAIPASWSLFIVLVSP